MANPMNHILDDVMRPSKVKVTTQTCLGLIIPKMAGNIETRSQWNTYRMGYHLGYQMVTCTKTSRNPIAAPPGHWWPGGGCILWAIILVLTNAIQCSSAVGLDFPPVKDSCFNQQFWEFRGLAKPEKNCRKLSAKTNLALFLAYSRPMDHKQFSQRHLVENNIGS